MPEYTTEDIRAARETWCVALEDGTRVQGKTYLRRYNRFAPDEYCCLGVLHEVAGGPDGEGGEWNEEYLGKDGTGGRIIRFNTSAGGVSGITQNPDLMIRLGLDNADHLALIDMNDSYGFTFPQIAEVVRAAEPVPGGIHELYVWLEGVHRQQMKEGE